jgi:hypothetical protein
MSKPHPTAELKNFAGLEAWEWFEGGIRNLELTGVGVLADFEEVKFQGCFVNEDHYAIILEEDCDVYMPRSQDVLAMFEGEESPEDRLLASFRKAVVPKELTDLAWGCLETAAGVSDNRGMAAGPLVEKYLRSNAQNGNLVPLGPNRAKYLLPDGSVGSTTIANRVRSGIMGNFDASPRVPYCRQTGWSAGNPEKTQGVIPFLEALNGCFRRQAPNHWVAQKKFVDDFKIHPDWTLGDTVFTTVTVNKDWQTAVHQDAGDFPGGYGNLSVVEGRPYKGGYTGFPKFRIAVNVRTGDFLAMNVHEWHGNTRMTPILPPPEGQDSWGDTMDPDADHGFDRLSLVCYARYGMRECEGKEKEGQKYLKFRENFLSSKEKASYLERVRQQNSKKAVEEIEYLQALMDTEEG